MRRLLLLFFLPFFLAGSRSTMKESIVVKKDFGPIVYAEDYYRLYSVPMYYNEEDLRANMAYLASALAAPFDFVNRALCVIETEGQYRAYKNLLHMQFNYLIVQNCVYLAALYDKQRYFFYNEQFKKEIGESLGHAQYYYTQALKYWKDTVTLATAVSQSKEKPALDLLVDQAHKIRFGDVNYEKTIRRRLSAIDGMLAAINGQRTAP